MIRRYFYLIGLVVSIGLSSFWIQAEIHRPSLAIEKAADYQSIESSFCITGLHGKFLEIQLVDGDLPKGTQGLLLLGGMSLNQGDCASANLQLKPAGALDRFAFIAKTKNVEVVSKSSAPLSYISEIRSRLTSLQGEPQNLVAGLAVGIDSGLSESFKNNMKATGLTHLTAVSGANCAIVLGLVWLALRKFRIGRGVRTVIALLVLGGYVYLVGWQASVLRSAFMMSVVFVSLELGRRIWVTAALAIGSGILLIVDPWMIFDYGFWLSVLATFGLVTLTPSLIARLSNHFPKWLAVALAATLSSQLWCLPILILLQGGFTTHSILANLLVEPMVAIITVLGLLAALVLPIFPPLGELILQIAALPASWIVWVANSLAGAPMAQLPVPADLVTLTLVALFVYSTSRAIRDGKFAFVGIAVVLGLSWVGFLGAGAIHSVQILATNWQVMACDVGQGDALVIRSGKRFAVVDVGREPKLINECLNNAGVREISLLVLTHFDQDHVGGLSGLLKGRKIQLALISAFPDSRPEAASLTELIKTQAQEVVVANKNLTGKLGQMGWRVISSLGSAGTSANESSLGMVFESSDLLLYTLADLNEVAQSIVLAEIWDTSKPTVVKVSHHGSADQSQELYRKIGADAALISVGVENSYGHPTRKALQILRQTNTQVFRTDRQGSIAVGVSKGALEVLVARDG